MSNDKMKEFTLFWRTGKSEIVSGIDAASAMNNAGYGAGSVRALDFYAEGDVRAAWAWDATERSWSKVE